MEGKKWDRQWMVHFLMTVVGGFFGTYALVMRGGVFASAQTGNFMEMMIEAAELLVDPEPGMVHILLIRFGTVVVFGGSMAISSLLTNHTKLPMKKVTLLVEAVGAVLTAFIPVEVEPILALYPIFFISSFQWGTFAGVPEYNCATIFSTNNFRQSVTGWTEYFVTSEVKYRRKAIFYTITILCFLMGAFGGAVLSLIFGPVSLLFSLLLLAAAWIVME